MFKKHVLPLEEIDKLREDILKKQLYLNEIFKKKQPTKTKPRRAGKIKTNKFVFFSFP